MSDPAPAPAPQVAPAAPAPVEQPPASEAPSAGPGAPAPAAEAPAPAPEAPAPTPGPESVPAPPPTTPEVVPAPVATPEVCATGPETPAPAAVEAPCVQAQATPTTVPSGAQSSSGDSTSMKIIEMTVCRVKPKYILQFVQCVPEGKKFWEKFGGHSLGNYITECGGSSEVILFLEWSSLDARCEALHTAIKDPEYLKFMAEKSKYTHSYENYCCAASGQWDHTKMKEKLAKGGKIYLEQLVIKSFPWSVAQTHALAKKFWNEKMTAHGFPLEDPIAVLHPIAFSNNCIILLWDIPNNKVDPIVKALTGMFIDPANQTRLAEDWKVFHEQSVRIISPIMLDMFPKQEG